MPKVRGSTLRWCAIATFVVSVLAVETAAVESISIPFPVGGETMGGSAGQVVPLSSTAFLAGTVGVDGDATTVNDVTLLVTRLDTGSPVVTTISTPYLSDYSGRVERLSATRVVMFHAGEDGEWLSGDEGIYIIDRIGSALTVISDVVGSLHNSDGSAPVGLDESTVILTSYGEDETRGTADDSVALVRGIGGTPVVTHLPAPYLGRIGGGRPVALDARSFLVLSAGPDGEPETGDELAYLFTEVDGTPIRQELATPGVLRRGSGAPIALSANRAMMCGTGEDLQPGTDDDVVFLLDDLQSVPTVTELSVPWLNEGGVGRIVRVDENTVLLLTRGEDGLPLTEDDTLVVITGIGVTNTITSHVIGYFADDGFRPAFLSPDTIAMQTAGPDGEFENADDEVVVVADFLGTPRITRHQLSGLDEGQSSQAVPLGPDAFLVSNAGPDGDLDTGEDDRFSIVVGATSASPTVEHVDIDGENNTYWASQLPKYLGGGRVAVVSGGEDQMVTTGGDDVFQVLSGLPSIRDLRVLKAKLVFREDRPEKGEKAKVKATLTTDGASPFGGLGVMVSVGNAAQFLPAADLKFRKGTWKYTDRKGKKGWVRKLLFKTKNGKLIIKGKGLETGIETTAAGHIAVAIEGNGNYYGETPAGEAKKKGLQYKAGR